MIYGFIGSGKTTLAETLFGARNTYQAKINGQKVTIKTPRDAIKAKMLLYQKKEENKVYSFRKIL